MPVARLTPSQIALLAVAVVSAVVLISGVIGSLVDDAGSPPWLLAAAVLLVASLTWLTGLRARRR